MANDDKRVKLEMESMATVYAALQKLDSVGQRWVLRCVMDRLNIAGSGNIEREADREVDESVSTERASTPTASVPAIEASTATDGISPVASKWMVRNGLTAASLSSLYSIGLEDIDLVAPDVPGSSKKDRMRSVILLKGIASYLSSGAARVSDEKIREACVHYDAFDAANFAKHLRGFAREVGGTRESGYTLTAAGVAGATEMIKELLQGEATNSAPSRKKRAKRSS